MGKSEQKRICLQAECAVREELRHQLAMERKRCADIVRTYSNKWFDVEIIAKDIEGE